MNVTATVSGASGRLEIDLGAVARNWRALDKIAQHCLTSAVIKADAYGCGQESIGRTLFAAGARFFFVATPDEGIALRATLPDAHIFVLNGLFPGTGDLYRAHRLMPVLGSMPMLEEWMQICLTHNEAFPAALHFDTGMNRLGFRLSETDDVRMAIDQFGYMPQVVMSHLACADTPNHEKNRTQAALFQSVLAQFPGIPASLANSAGLMNARENHYQMVRPGVALFGGRAVAGRPNPMSAVVHLNIPVLQIRDVKTGESIGYGATQTAARNTRLAILAMGYADGFFRTLSSTDTRIGGMAAFNGRICPVAGRVSMDMIAIDVTELGAQGPRPGDMAEILGPTISVDDQADAAGTIGYEVLTSLKGRYERSYVESASASR